MSNRVIEEFTENQILELENDIRKKTEDLQNFRVEVDDLKG
jgi:hypothetical protein